MVVFLLSLSYHAAGAATRRLGEDATEAFLVVCFSALVQELRESRGGRPGLSVLTSLPVSVDVKLY